MAEKPRDTYDDSSNQVWAETIKGQLQSAGVRLVRFEPFPTEESAKEHGSAGLLIQPHGTYTTYAFQGKISEIFKVRRRKS